MSVNREDLLLSIDAAIAQLHTTRRMVELFHEDAEDADTGQCKHARTQATFDGLVCLDCAADLASPGERDHGVAGDDPAEPTG